VCGYKVIPKALSLEQTWKQRHSRSREHIQHLDLTARCHERNQSFMKKWQIPGKMQGKYKIRLECLVPENKGSAQ
jgi:hypothetical protein